MAVLDGVELLTLFCCLDARSCRGQVHVLVLDEVRDRERGCWPYTMEKGVNPVVDEHDEGRTVCGSRVALVLLLHVHLL
jgi:hypothetical protein